MNTPLDRLHAVRGPSHPRGLRGPRALRGLRALRQALHGAVMIAVAGLGLGLAAAVRADDDAPTGAYGLRQPLLPLYAQECGECHVAYPPLLLPPVSWARLLGHLDRHFGVDASLDAPTQQQIARWLADTSLRRSHLKVAPPEDRLTRTRWFLHEHDEIAPATFRRPAIRSASNCSACHRGAVQGDYDEDSVAIPR